MERLPTTRGHLRSRGRSSASRTDPWGTGALRRGQRAWHLDDDSGRPVPAGPHVGDDSAAGQHEPAGQAGHPEQGQLLDVELVPEPAVPVVLVRTPARRRVMRGHLMAKASLPCSRTSRQSLSAARLATRTKIVYKMSNPRTAMPVIVAPRGYSRPWDRTNSPR